MPGEVERPVMAARRGWATIPSFGAVRRGALPPMSRRRHVWELIGSLVLGDGRLEPGGHRLASDERQHDFGRVVRQRPSVAPTETECRGRPDYEGQDIGEEFPGNGSPVALWVAPRFRSPRRRRRCAGLPRQSLATDAWCWREWRSVRRLARRSATSWDRASCAWAESEWDSRIGEILIQPAGWAEASRRWQSRIRKICATG